MASLRRRAAPGPVLHRQPGLLIDSIVQEHPNTGVLPAILASDPQGQE